MNLLQNLGKIAENKWIEQMEENVIGGVHN